MCRRTIIALVALVAAAVAMGCGVGSGKGTDDVQLTVTRDFGRDSLFASTKPKVSGDDTVMRLLQRNAPVKTRYGGGFVQAIGDLAGGRKGGRPYDWFFYINGSLADEGAASTDLHKGDRVWWDHHDWGVTSNVKAVIGSFPAPFRNGLDGKKLPVRVECSDPKSKACDVVADKLVDLGVVAGRSGLGESAADTTLRVLVGPWNRIRGGEAEADLVDRGPRRSGIFARFDKAGDQLTVLDERGRAARTLGAGTGLIAATEANERKPVWFITGTDAAGVETAAEALEEATVADRYALAIADDTPISVPLVGGAG